MTLRHVRDLSAPIGEVIDQAARDGVLIDTGGRTAFAVMALDDELVDYLLERNPKFIRDCRAIRKRMQQGKYLSHGEVRRQLAPKARRRA